MARLLIDLDGVLLEQIGQDWFNWLKKQFRFKKEFHNLITETYLSARLPYDLTTLFHTGDFHTGFEFWNNEYLYEHYKPESNTVKFMTMLHLKGHEIVIVSKVIGAHGFSKELWIRKNFPYAKIVFTGDKYLVKGDWMVDDTYKVLNSMPSDVKIIKYRNDYQENEALTREDCLSAYSFEDVYNLITGD